jgi:SpoVK/Ycf46/Vps4 family AAA+-type ATPase
MRDSSVEDELIRATAVKTRGFSGADLENLCRSAGVFANARGATAVSCDDLAAVMAGRIAGLLLA